MIIDIDGEKPNYMSEENWEKLKEFSLKIFEDNDNEKLRNEKTTELKELKYDY